MGGFESAGGRQRRQRRGTDVRIKVKLTLEDIAKGVSKTLKIPVLQPDPFVMARRQRRKRLCHLPHLSRLGSGHPQSADPLGVMQTAAACPQCGGEGKIITEKCPNCQGEGVKRSEETVSFNIPAGVADGMVLTLKGKGNAARHGGVNGDLLVVIEEVKHPDLIRDGNDIIYNLMLDIPTATLGGSVEVPTLTGRARLKIPAGTQPGKVLRLRGKGLPSTDGYAPATSWSTSWSIFPKSSTTQSAKLSNHFRDSPT